jgi:VIT1/CCC1 family predicted Fe2+/Mn2+ transporter
MAHRYVIKEKNSGKYFHLSVGKGSYIVRSYENNITNIKEKGKELSDDSDFWKTYTKIGDAPYHSIEDVDFWNNYLQNAPETVSETAIKKTKSTIKISQIISIVAAILGVLSPCIVFLKIDNIQINITYIASGYIVIGLLIGIFLFIVFALISRLLKTTTTLQTINKEQASNLKKTD